MKNCDEMVNSLFERRDKFNMEKRRKRKILINTIAPLCFVCIIAVSGIILWQNGVFDGGKIAEDKKASSSVINTESNNEEFSEGSTGTMQDIKDGNYENNHGALPGTVDDADDPQLYKGESFVTSSSSTSSSETLAVAKDYVNIYIVKDKKIVSERIYLPLEHQKVFAVWKEKNGIGDEVKLVKTFIEDNSETYTSEYNGSGVATHIPGDYYVFNIVVSKDIENYYTKTDKKLLLESLKKTLTGYSYTKYDSCNLIIE